MHEVESVLHFQIYWPALRIPRLNWPQGAALSYPISARALADQSASPPSGHTSAKMHNHHHCGCQEKAGFRVNSAIRFPIFRLLVCSWIHPCSSCLQQLQQALLLLVIFSHALIKNKKKIIELMWNVKRVDWFIGM